jgi:hypothetical protein
MKLCLCNIGPVSCARSSLGIVTTGEYNRGHMMYVLIGVGAVCIIAYVIIKKSQKQ